MFLRERYRGKLYLHGHCLASLSVASVATRLKSDGVSGLILSSARSTGKDGAVSVPVLLVNHRDDSCPYTPYSLVERVKAFYQNSVPKVDMIAVTGGEARVAMKQRCQNGFHASLEKMTYNAVTGTVIYRSKMHAGLKRNFQVISGAAWLELSAGTSQIATNTRSGRIGLLNEPQVHFANACFG